MNVENKKNELYMGNPKMTPQNVNGHCKHVCINVGRFFYENEIILIMKTSLFHFRTCHFIGSHSRDIKPTFMYEPKTWIGNNELNTTKKIIEGIKNL